MPHLATPTHNPTWAASVTLYCMLPTASARCSSLASRAPLRSAAAGAEGGREGRVQSGGGSIGCIIHWSRVVQACMHGAHAPMHQVEQLPPCTKWGPCLMHGM